MVLLEQLQLMLILDWLYDYFKKHYKLVAVDLSKQKELDADPRTIQQTEFKYMLETDSAIY